LSLCLIPSSIICFKKKKNNYFKALTPAGGARSISEAQRLWPAGTAAPSRSTIFFAKPQASCPEGLADRLIGPLGRGIPDAPQKQALTARVRCENSLSSSVGLNARDPLRPHLRERAPGKNRAAERRRPPRCSTIGFRPTYGEGATTGFFFPRARKPHEGGDWSFGRSE